MAIRLPDPGGDDGVWGTLLNNFLDVEHNADGTLKIRTDGTFYKKPTGGIPESDLVSAVQTKIDAGGTAYQKPAGGIPSGDLASSVTDAIGNATKIQGTSVDGSAPSDGQVLVYSGGSSAWVPNTVTSTTVSDATSSTKGILQLTGNLGGTASSPTVVSTSLSSALPVSQGGTGATTLTGVVKGNGTGAFTAATASDFPTLNQDTTGNAATATAANGLKSATTTVSVSGATAPTTGQVLTATSSTAATWQTPSGGGGGGGYSFNFVSKTANYTASNLDFVFVDSTSSGITITLPAPAANAFVRVKRLNGGSNSIQVAAPSGAYIDASGVGTDTINNQYQSQDYLSDGTNWYRV